MVLTLMSRKSLEAEEVVAHAVVRVGNLHPYPAFAIQSWTGRNSQKSVDTWSYKVDMLFFRVYWRYSDPPHRI